MNRLSALIKSLKKKPEYIIFFVILLLAVFFAFYRLTYQAIFDWDQERDAYVAWDMIKNLKPPLAGPRVVSDHGFFLGPLWFYIIAPFYLITGFDPIAGALSSAVIHITTLILVFIIVRKLYDSPTALISSLIYSLFVTKVSWNPILIPCFGIVIFYLLTQILKGKNKLLPLLMLIAGLSLNIHFQSIIFFLPTLTSVIYLLVKKKLTLKQVAVSLVFFSITFLPLIVFDLRHDFINTRSFLGFFSGKGTYLIDADNPLIKYLGSLPYSVSQKFLIDNIIVGGAVTLLIAVYGIKRLKDTSINKINLLTLLLTPFFVYLFYKGQKSEYYYFVTAIPVLIGFSHSLKLLLNRNLLGKIIVFAILAGYVVSRTEYILNHEEKWGLYYKKQAVLHIINQKQDPIYNVSYSTKEGQSSGFSYLFQYYGKSPTNSQDGHLWTIVIPANNEDVPPLAIYGDIGVIRR